jgi:hypothetical protein
MINCGKKLVNSYPKEPLHSQTLNKRIKNMLSFHNDIKVKEKYVNRVKAHAKADNLIQGVGWENGKGCAIGCTLESFDHSAYPTELGLPEWSAKLEDRLFEGMENKYAMKFPLDFLEAIPVGVDLEPVKWKFCSYLCSENLSIVENCDIDKDLKSQVSDSIKTIKSLHDNAAKTGVWYGSVASSAAWSAADSAACSVADSAASSAACSAAYSAACSAADSAAWSVASSAWSVAYSAAYSVACSAAYSAAWSAAYSAADSAAHSAAYKKYTDHLLKLLRKA